MLSALVDVFRLRQYFDVATRVSELAEHRVRPATLEPAPA